MLNITEDDLKKAGYSLELWNGGTLRDWVKKSDKTQIFIRVSIEFEGGSFIAKIVTRSTIIPLAGLDTLEEVDAIYKILVKGVSISPQELFEKTRAA